MDAAFQRRTLEAFEAVLDQPDEDRQAWIAQQHSADPELLAALRRLLDTDRQHARALPTVVPQARGLAPELTAPERVGVWRLAQCLGHGGMGQVYLGQRDDGLFEQNVAIKLMSPSLFPAAALQLFDNERRVLARLRHPHIAQIVDGGVTPQGLPFFAMELVEGEAIDRYCAARDLPVAAVVRLFLDACSAVSHAHQNLVVHADLKPSNIHVDDAGQVKLLDFGIARLVAQGSEQTEEMPQPLTPAYASPNRQSGEAATPADDVYSLGVVLFELLTGARPEPPNLTASRAVMMAGATAADRSRQRKRAGLLSGDLDSITARAMAPQAEHRYPSVDALVADLERWRQTLPVHARAGGWRYRARKFLVRNRLGVAVGVVAISSLSLALVVTTRLYLRAESARVLAEQRFNDVRSMSRFMLFDLFDTLASVPGTTTVRRDIADAGRSYLEKLASDPQAPIDVRFDVASGYSRLGHIKAMTSTVGTGDLEVGRSDLERAERLLRGLVAAKPERVDFTLELAKTLAWRASVVSGTGNDLDVAEKLDAEGRALLEGLLVRDPGDATLRFWSWNARLGQTDLLNERADYAQMITVLDEALRTGQDLQPPPALASMVPLLLSATHDNLGNAWYYSGDVARALQHYQAALASLRDSPSFTTDVRYISRAGGVRYNIASTLQEQGHLPEALALLDEGLAQVDRAMAFETSPALEHSRRVMADTRAQILSELGRHDEAITQVREEVATIERRAAQHPQDYDLARSVVYALRPLGDVYAGAGKHAESCDTYRKAEQGWKAMAKISPPSAQDVGHEIALLTKLLKDC